MTGEVTTEAGTASRRQVGAAYSTDGSPGRADGHRRRRRASMDLVPGTYKVGVTDTGEASTEALRRQGGRRYGRRHRRRRWGHGLCHHRVGRSQRPGGRGGGTIFTPAPVPGCGFDDVDFLQHVLAGSSRCSSRASPMATARASLPKQIVTTARMASMLRGARTDRDR